MVLLRPNSILQLTAAGFLAVVAPLVIALVIISQKMDTLSERSRVAISEAAQAMRAGRVLIEQASAMERNARQYGILNDEKILQVYIDRRQDFIESVNLLRDLEINEDITSLSNQLVADEKRIFNILNDAPEKIEKSTHFHSILNSSHRISREINEWTEAQGDRLNKDSDRTLYLLRIGAFTLIVTVLFLAGIFTALITRPLRQIDHAIHQLGKGHYDNEIQVNGPLDLRELGTRLDWLRRRLEKLEQQRTRFLRHVSHELKTPLTAIQEGVSLLNEGLAGSLSRQQTEIIAILRNNCQRLQKLIENLLRYRTNNPVGADPVSRTVRFDNLINRVVDDQSPGIKNAGIMITRHIEKITVNLDEEQLRAIVDNLLSNAIRYSPEGGVIYLRLEQEEDEVVFSVQDEGSGIPPEERERVFEAFYQGKRPENENIQGTGLGLAIAAEYVHMNGGVIGIPDSETGAKFEVRIPVQQETINKQEERK